MPTLVLDIDPSGAVRGSRVVDGAFDKVKRGARSTTKATDQVTGSFGRLGTKSGALAKRLIVTGLGFAALTAGVRSAISTHKEFSTAISNLSAITGATGKDLAFYAEQAKLIGKTTSLSATQAVTAFKLIASAKPDLLASADALAEVTKQAVILAEAATIELPAAADALASSLNQFGESADQAARFINVLAAGSKFGASEIATTAAALKEAGTVASSAGVSFEGMNAAVQVLAEISLKGRRAGVQLRNVILELLAGADATNPKIVGLSEAFRNLGEQNLDAVALMERFGKENVVAAQRLAENADKLDHFLEVLTGTNTAVEQAHTNMDNLGGDWLAFKSAVEAVKIETLEGLGTALREFTQAARDFSIWTSENVDSIAVLFEALAKGLAAFVAVKAAAAVWALVAAGSGLTAMMTGLTAAIALNPFGAAAVAVGAVIAAFVLYENNLTTVQERQEAYLAGIEEIEGARPDRSMMRAADATSVYEEALAGLNDEIDPATMALFSGLIAGIVPPMEKAAKATVNLANAQQVASKAFAGLQRNIALENSQLERLIRAAKLGETQLKAMQRQIRVETDLRTIRNQAIADGNALSTEELGVLEKQLQLREALNAELEASTDALHTTEPAKIAAGGMEEIFNNAIENIQHSFGQMFEEVFDKGLDGFQDFGERLKDIFTNVAGQMAAALLTKGIQGLVRAIQNEPGPEGGGGFNLGGLFGGGGGGGNLDFGNILASLGVSGSGSFNVGEIASGFITGVASGYAFGTGTGGSNIGAKIGGYIGSLVGSVIGSRYGGSTGSNILGTIGNAAGGRIGEGFYNLRTYQSIFSPEMSRSKMFGTALHLPGFAAKDMSVPGATKPFLAMADLHHPGFGAFLTAIGLANPKQGKLQLRTTPFGDTSGFEGDVFRGGPFGNVGLNQPATQKTQGRALRSIVSFFRDVDEVIATYLDDAQIALVAERLQNTSAIKKKFKDFDDEMSEMIRNRLATTIDAVVGDPGFARRTGVFADIKTGKGREPEFVARATQFLTERADFVQLIAELRGVAEPVTAASVALDALRAQFDEITMAAVAYGVVLDDVGELLAQATAQMTTGFDDSVRRAILGRTDPLALALEDLEAMQAERLREADFLGANISEVERLHMLERQAIVEQFAGSTTRLLDELLNGPSSPLAPETVLANARAAFTGAVAGGSSFAIEEASRNLLDASRAMFASSAMFFEDFNLVIATLQGLPGAARGGQFTVPGAGFDDTVIPFRASGGETVTITPSGSVDASALVIAEVGAREIELLEELVGRVDSLEDSISAQVKATADLAARRER